MTSIRGWTTYLALGVLTLSLVGVGMFWWLRESEQFKAAEAFVKESPEVKASLGEVFQTSLSPRRMRIGGRTSDGRDAAALVVWAKGAKAEGWVFTELEKDGRGRWVVTEATLQTTAGRQRLKDNPVGRG